MMIWWPWHCWRVMNCNTPNAHVDLTYPQRLNGTFFNCMVWWFIYTQDLTFALSNRLFTFSQPPSWLSWSQLDTHQVPPGTNMGPTSCDQWSVDRESSEIVVTGSMVGSVETTVCSQTWSEWSDLKTRLSGRWTGTAQVTHWGKVSGVLPVHLRWEHRGRRVTPGLNSNSYTFTFHVITVACLCSTTPGIVYSCVV